MYNDHLQNEHKAIHAAAKEVHGLVLDIIFFLRITILDGSVLLSLNSQKSTGS